MSQSQSGIPTPDGSGSNPGAQKAKKKKKKKRNQHGQAGSTFQGRAEAIKQFVYDIGPKSKDVFAKTTREIAEYVARTYKGGGEFLNAMNPDDLGFITIPTPPDPDPTDRLEIEKWKLLLKRQEDDSNTRNEISKQVFAVILGQCSESVRDRITAQSRFESVRGACDVIELLKLIKSSLCTGSTNKNVCQASQEATEKLFAFKQTSRMSNAKCLEQFKELIDMVECSGTILGEEPDRVCRILQKIAVNKTTPTQDEIDEAKSQARDECCSVLFIRKADPNRYGSMIVDIENAKTRGHDECPKTMPTACDYLVNCKSVTKPVAYDQQEEGVSYFTANQGEGRGQHGRGGRGRARNQGRGARGGRGGRGNYQAHHNAASESDTDSDEGEEEDNKTGKGSAHVTEDPQAADCSNNAKAGSEDHLTSIYHAEVLVTEQSLPDNTMLLDSCSSANIISNPSLLRDIFVSPTTLPVRTLAGMVCLTKKGYFGTCPQPMWHHPEGTVNILSLNEACDHSLVTLDSEKDRAFHAHQDDGSVVRFGATNNGLFSCAPVGKSPNDALWTARHNVKRRTSNNVKKRKISKEHANSDNLPTADVHIMTVKEIAKMCPKRLYQRAVRARKMQNIIMRPGSRQLGDVAIKHLANCPVSKADVEAAEHIFGTNTGALKGKTPRQVPEHVRANIDPVPRPILQIHEHVTLCIDIMFVNKIPFFITRSRNLCFGTIDVINNRRATTIARQLRNALRLHSHRGFNVATILGDDEFEPLREHHPNLNTAAANEHVPDIERHIRTVKDRTRSGYNSLPYRHIPRLVLIHLVRNAVLWLNALPANDGVSTEHSPRCIMTGKELTHDKHAKLEFGQHAQVHEEHDNSMTQRTMGAICLGPTGNDQGGHWFMSLTSGAKVIRNRWTALPMPTDAIERASEIGRRQGMPSTITYSNRHGEEIMDTIEDFEHDSDIDDDSHDPDDDDDSDDDDDLCYDTDDEHSLSMHDPDSDGDSNNGSNHDDDDSDIDEDQDDDEPEDEDDDSDTVLSNVTYHFDRDTTPDNHPSNDIRPTGVRESTESTGVGDIIGQTGVDHDDESTIDDNENDDLPPTLWDEINDAEEIGRMAAMNDESIPKRRKRDNPKHADACTLLADGISHLIQSDFMSFVTIAEMNVIVPDQCFLASLVPHATELMSFLTEQMTAKKGLELFGERGAEALTKELKQLVSMEVMHGAKAQSLTYQQKMAALKHLMFLKEKRSGVVKGRGCADGRKQRVYKTKEETHAPTASAESVFLTSIMDAYEGRDVAIVDIPGAFMQSRIDELMHVKLEGELVDLLARIDPACKPCVTMENGRKALCTELDKALCGAMQAALLFWKKLSGFLTRKGFKINPYDHCVANKTINGMQCTICWHVDDLKISHKSPKVVTEVISMISAKFAKKAPLTIHRGRVFDDYLGMKVDFSKPGKVIFSMVDCIERILDECPDGLMKGPCATPAANHLFRVNENGKKLNSEDADMHHHLTAMLLYLSKRARPDMQTAVSFLCTRVQVPDIDDWRKLGRCIRYLSATKNLPLTLEMDNTKSTRWWVDASFAVHPNMRSHTGATMTIGKGSPCSMSSKQKLNTRSSTEAELVGVSDAMTLALWTRNFLKAQGMQVTDNAIHQDNQSAMLLENNGKRSSSKQTRHIDIRYYFITDMIAKNIARVHYCPTDDMTADYFTKPLQGSAFIKFRNRILNIEAEESKSSAAPQECVETGKKESVPGGTVTELKVTSVTKKDRRQETKPPQSSMMSYAQAASKAMNKKAKRLTVFS